MQCPNEPGGEGASRAERLTDRQRVFVDCYLGEHFLNATRAALAAGYSPKCAAQQGSRNLAKPHIRHYIDQRLRKHESSVRSIRGYTHTEKESNSSQTVSDAGCPQTTRERECKCNCW